MLRDESFFNVRFRAQRRPRGLLLGNIRRRKVLVGSEAKEIMRPVSFIASYTTMKTYQGFGLI